MKEYILRKDRLPFTQLANDLLNNKLISSKAKGIYGFMYSKPDNFTFTIKSLESCLYEGESAIASALVELKLYGWVTYKKNPDGTGEYFLHTKPKQQNPVLDINPKLDFPIKGKSRPINNTIHTVINNNNIDFNKLLDFLNKKTSRKFRVITDAIKKKYIARIKEGYTKENIMDAITSACQVESHKSNGFRYLTPEFFSRQSTLDKYGVKAAETPEQMKSMTELSGKDQGKHVNY